MPTEQVTFYDLGYDKLLNKGVTLQGAISPLNIGLLPGNSAGGFTNLVSGSVNPGDLTSGDIGQVLNLSKNGYIIGGATGYDAGDGFFLGYRVLSDDYGFFIGNSTGNKLTYNTTNDVLSVTGTITASVGAIGGWNITATTLYALASGTPSAFPTDGIVLTSGATSSIVIYEDGDARMRIGNLAAGVFGIRLLDGAGTTTLFEISDTTSNIAGWNIVDGYLYNLQSGTPTAVPNDGIVLASGNEGIIIYEDTEIRTRIGFLSAGIYGILGYATDGSTKLFELSDTQNFIAGWTISSTTLANSTNIILDASNRAISINSATFGTSGIQLQYNAGIPRLYVGNGTTQFFQYDGTNISWGAVNTTLSTAGHLTTTSATIAAFTIATTTISATNLTLTSGVANTANITVGTGATAGGMNSANVGTDITFWSGSTFANRATAPFRVEADGSLVATDATITGSIITTSGTIGGFDIGSDYIRDAANSFGLASTVTIGDDVRFWSGATFANRAIAPFRVTEVGAVTATSITLSTNVVLSGLQAGSSIDGQYLAALSVVAASIANATITGGKIGSATITGSNIASATITGSLIASATITATNIAAATITGTQIASATITSDHIVNATIVGADIASATIAGSNIASATITGSLIASATITGSNIASATITGSNIASATITGSNIGSATITGANIASAVITSDHIVNATIVSADIASATITGSNIASATITGSNIANTTIAAGNIISGTITTTQIASGTITGGNIASATITGSNIASTTITATNITALTITAAEIANLTVNGAKIASGSITPIKTNVPVFMLSAGTFTDNSPGAGSVAWAGALVVYNGTESTITNSNTASRYITWDSAAPTAFSGSATVPTSDTVWLVGMNNSGTYLSTWDMPQIHGEQIQSATITGTQIASATITATNITAATITGSLIASATITAANITAGTITSTEIANGTITGTDIAAATIAASNIVSGTITATQIANATITGTQIASGTITSDNITNATITGADIASATITSTNIANATITTTQISATAGITGSQIANTTITASNIANATITTTQISGSAGITGGQIANTTITAANITNATVTATQMADGAITPVKTTIPTFVVSAGTFTDDTPDTNSVSWTSAKVVYNGTESTITNSNTSSAFIIWNSATPTAFAGSATVPTSDAIWLVGKNVGGIFTSMWDMSQVDGVQIQSNSITATQIANATITTTQISGSAGITGSQIANNTITAINITNATITTSQISGSAGITGSQIANTTIAAANIVNATITTTQIASATITGSNIASATITGSNIAATTITAANIAATTITATEIANLTITAGKIANATITGTQIDSLSVSGKSCTFDTGTIGGFTMSATQLTATNFSVTSGVANAARLEVGTGANTAGINSANVAGDITFWSGATFANRATASFNVQADGTVTATDIQISTANSTIAGASLINGSTASNIQDRGESDYKKPFKYNGRSNDGFTESATLATITRQILNTHISLSADAGAQARFYSGTLGSSNATSATALVYNNYDMEFSVTVQMTSIISQDGFFGTFASTSPPGINSTDTTRHIGFYLEDGTLYASNADGTTQTKTSVGAITLTNPNHLYFIYDVGTDIEFYLNDTLVVTHNTTMPTTGGNPRLMFWVANATAADRGYLIKNNYLLLLT